MSDYPALAAALKRPEFDGLDDAATVAALLTAVETVDGPIPARAVKRLWGQRMVLAAARVAADDPVTPKPLRILCRAAYDNLMGDLFADLDPSDPTQGPTIAAFLDGLQAAGVLSDAVRAETLALSRTEAPLLERIGWGVLRNMDADSARKTIATARENGK